MKPKRIILVGAGNIGSRHLQALKAVKVPLEVFVVDTSDKSLELSKSRYESMPEGEVAHEVNYFSEIPKNLGAVDLAIVATCSDIRAETVRKLLKKIKVKFLILEKLLFCKKSDYESIGRLVKTSVKKTWVNCPMRIMPFYRDMQKKFSGQVVSYHASWGGYGLATSAVHYIDHMVFLTGSDDFAVTTDALDKKTIPSKRKGFVELTGVLRILFKNGSVGDLVCFKNGDAARLVQFHSDKLRCLVREAENRAMVSEAKNNWAWEEIEAPIPLQSQLTTGLVEDILVNGDCGLPAYKQSVKIHLQLLEPLRKFLNKNLSKKYSHFPFT